MARFRLKAALIPKLTSSGVISSTSGKIKLRFPYLAGAITGAKCFEVEFNPTDILEATNPAMVKVIALKRSPPIKLNNGWLIADPAVAWFDRLADDAAGTVVVVDAEDKEIFTKAERLLMHNYVKRTGNSAPVDFRKNQVAASATHLAAKQYFKDHPEHLR